MDNELNNFLVDSYVKKNSRKEESKNPDSPQKIPSFSELGGIDNIVGDLFGKIINPFKNRELYVKFDIPYVRGILICGPSGCGKSTIIDALIAEMDINSIQISATDFISNMTGGSEAKIRQLFKKAHEKSPCLIIIDHVDILAGKRENSSRELDKRLLYQLANCMDDVHKNSNADIIVIGMTNDITSIDPSMRRFGRFGYEIKINIPDEKGRYDILQKLFSNRVLDADVQLMEISRKTPGFLVADLKALFQGTIFVAFNRCLSLHERRIKENSSEMCESYNNFQELIISKNDFSTALLHVQPSAKREGFAIASGISWNDIGALQSIRQTLDRSVIYPLKYPELYRSMGLKVPVGILLWGPPGCGKTLVAKAIANESHLNFISVKGPELLNKFLGESERAIRVLFERARLSAPCVIFFDEIDALCPKRNLENDTAASRVVNQLLTEMDGLEDRGMVFIMCASNRPELIDSAIRRPGRVDKLLYVGLPDADERLQILKTLLRNVPYDQLINLEEIANDMWTLNFSGADLASLVREATIISLSEYINENEISKDNCNVIINEYHFMAAFKTVRPSITLSEKQHYERLHDIFK